MTVFLKVKVSAPALPGSTACPAGAFETSARLDAQAAMMRNLTRVSGVVVGRDWSINHAGTPETYPEVTDKPEG